MIASCLQGVLFLAPALLLLLVLRLRRHPGERLILALHGRARGARRRVGSMRILARVHTAAAFPRGGHLIASSLAGRAPPIAPAAA